MAYITEPVDIFVNFLRSQIDELTRTQPSLSNRQTNTSDSFTGDNIETEFTLTPTASLGVVCVNSITVDGITQVPYQDYNYDLDNKKIKFATAPGDTLAIVVDYDEGSNWIHPDAPRDDLSQSSYPRIGVTELTESGQFQQMGNTETLDTVSFQIDVMSFKGSFATVNTESREGTDITTYLARQIVNKLKQSFVDELLYVFLGFTPIGNEPAPFEPSDNIFRRIVQVQLIFRNSAIVT